MKENPGFVSLYLGSRSHAYLEGKRVLESITQGSPGHFSDQQQQQSHLGIARNVNCGASPQTWNQKLQPVLRQSIQGILTLANNVIA